MTISKVKAAGWGVGEVLTSTQISSVDANIENALDKRSGQTDTLASVVSCSGAGRIVPTLISGADADTTYLISGGNSIIRAEALTAARTYQLSSTGAVTGDLITVMTEEASYTLRVVYGPGLSLAVYLSAGAVNASRWATFVYTGATDEWMLLSSSISASIATTTFTSSGTYTVPIGVTALILEGCGGGGGGGGGCTGDTTTANYPPSGGGGGGSQVTTKIVSVTAGGSYTVTIGSGGAGGVAGANGNAGADTTFDTLATFDGASGGVGGVATSSSFTVTPGGCPSRHVSSHAQSSKTPTSTHFVPACEMGSGGPGKNNNTMTTSGYSGVGSGHGYAGGAAGTKGTDSGSYNGGGPGGGGGAGAYGAGGAGANGGNANSGGTGSNGSAGSNAAANTGGGGGGGGGGGQGSAAGGTGGAGGNGGSGYLIVRPLR